MQHVDVDAIIERAKQALEVSQDQELADILSVSRSTVAAWRRRGSIPAKYLSEMLVEGTVSLDWLLTGSGEPKTVDRNGFTEARPPVDNEVLWLSLLALRSELKHSNSKEEQEISDSLTTDMLATIHIWLSEYLTRITVSKAKWEGSGLIKPPDLYRALVTEYAIGKFDSPPPPWWQDDAVI